VTYWPSALGGKNWNPMAYDPERKLAFANTLNIGLDYRAVEPDYRPGVMVFGADIAFKWPEDHRGILRAIDPLTGEHKWEDKVGIPRLGGAMATAGGLVFTGKQTGELEAFDSDTGELLWEFQAGSGFIGQPVTWEQDGRQFVSMAVGGGAVYALFGGDERLANVPAGGSIWTFALLGE
jgi:alcohol dehydrogenase (cytochrome c)